MNLCGKPARVTLRNTFTLEGASTPSELQRNDRTSPFFVQLPGNPVCSQQLTKMAGQRLRAQWDDMPLMDEYFEWMLLKAVVWSTRSV